MSKRSSENARSRRTGSKWHQRSLTLCGDGFVVDDLLRNNDGEIVVSDYKTRGCPPKQDSRAPDYHWRQVNLYNLILRENGHGTAEKGLILYFYPDTFGEDGKLVFTTEIREIEVDIQKARKTVRNGFETPEVGNPDHYPDCDFCEWSRQH